SGLAHQLDVLQAHFHGPLFGVVVPTEANATQPYGPVGGDGACGFGLGRGGLGRRGLGGGSRNGFCRGVLGLVSRGTVGGPGVAGLGVGGGAVGCDAAGGGLVRRRFRGSALLFLGIGHRGLVRRFILVRELRARSAGVVDVVGHGSSVLSVVSNL